MKRRREKSKNIRYCAGEPCIDCSDGKYVCCEFCLENGKTCNSFCGSGFNICGLSADTMEEIILEKL